MARKWGVRKWGLAMHINELTPSPSPPIVGLGSEIAKVLKLLEKMRFQPIPRVNSQPPCTTYRDPYPWTDPVRSRISRSQREGGNS